MTEIEIRGKLSRIDFDRLYQLLQQDGHFLNHYHRLSVDLSPGFDPVTRIWKNLSGTDIRLKKSDDQEKLSIKTGSFYGLKRQETEIKLQTSQFLHALTFLESLGYRTGMVYFWESWEFDYLGVEIKLSKYTADYYTFEIEGKKSLNIKTIAKSLNLTPYSAAEYRQAINWENQHIHWVYCRDLVVKILATKF